MPPEKVAFFVCGHIHKNMVWHIGAKSKTEKAKKQGLIKSNNERNFRSKLYKAIAVCR